jgi:hypothetical protein
MKEKERVIQNKKNQEGSGCCILTGQVQGGKTTLVETVVDGLHQRDLGQWTSDGIIDHLLQKTTRHE